MPETCDECGDELTAENESRVIEGLCVDCGLSRAIRSVSEQMDE